MLDAVVGINWGDEGKGRMVDMLAEKYDIIVRYQGGNNAGHTVVNSKGEFKLNLIPSGIFREEAVNILGQGMVVDPFHLIKEIDKLMQSGIVITPKNLMISDRASLCLPWNVQQDGLEEDRLGTGAFGSTRRGIAPAYSDRYMKKALRMEDLLLSKEDILSKLTPITDWKNLTIEKAYGQPPVSAEELTNLLMEVAKKLKPFIVDTGFFLQNAAVAGKKILFEAQLGALRDIDYGIYPYTSSSSTLSAYAPIGAGIPAW